MRSCNETLGKVDGLGNRGFGQKKFNSSRIENNNVGNRFNPRGYFKGLQSSCTTFFFTNIPESHGLSEMWTEFSKWGSVGDVIIPQKKDKKGNIFGFVRFKQLDDEDKLLKTLEQIWIGNYKIKINSPRFKRKEDRNFKGNSPTKIQIANANHFTVSGKRAMNLTWKEVLLNQNRSSFPITASTKKVLQYIPPNDVLASLNNQMGWRTFKMGKHSYLTRDFEQREIIHS
ncbi:hypothetical protein Lal_00004056 [Lupinus albus]|nr:hypothetical protein Lal_00004056 [Lupinus albus]